MTKQFVAIIHSDFTVDRFDPNWNFYRTKIFDTASEASVFIMNEAIEFFSELKEEETEEGVVTWEYIECATGRIVVRNTKAGYLIDLCVTMAQN